MKPTLPWYLRPARQGLHKAGCLFLFSLPFLAADVAVAWNMSGLAATEWWRARDWEPAEAVVQKAWLESDEGGECDSYQVAAEFTYTYHGRRHQGTRHSFVHNSTNMGVNGMRDTVRQLPRGKRVTCWVNPANPTEAVLDRSLPVEAVVGVFFSLPFLAVGGVGLGIPALPWLRRRLQRQRLEQLLPLVHSGRLPHWLPDLFQEHDATKEDRAALVIAQDERVTAVLALLFFNLFWNGIVAVFVCVAVISFASGETAVAVLLSLFLTPFIVIGGTMLWKCFKQGRLFSRPRWVAAVRPVPDFSGGEVEFSWAWLDADAADAARPPEASVRLVALAAVWDEESGSPNHTLSNRRRTQVSDPTATTKGELELAAVDLPPVEAAPGPLALQLPRVPPLSAQLHALAARKNEKLAQTPWGGWWQIEVTYPDGEVETVNLTEAVKLK